MPLITDDFGNPVNRTSGPKDGQPSRYFDYKQGNGYTYDSGKIVLPVAGPDGTPPRVIKTHAVIGKRSMVVTSTKVNTPPVIPKMGYDTAEGDVFLGGSLSLPLPQVNSAQGGFNYTASCNYEFIQPAAPRGYDPDSAYQMGVYPMDTPLLTAMASARQDQTVGNSGNPYVTDVVIPDQTIPTASSDWGWISTTFMPSFFFVEPVLAEPTPPV